MKMNVLVGEAMTKVIKKVDINDPIEKAAQIMRDERIGSAVVTGEKNVKGIVTTMDIVYKHVAGKKGQRVSDIMSTELVTISPGETIEEAARKMVKHNIEKLLVFDKGSLVGIITNNDIIRIQPAMIETLIERLKMSGPRMAEEGEVGITACESCGNYSDNTEEVGGAYLCQDCRE
ncbi:CBS domain-containing protein [Candidatus Woesearchaeota archaeon]|nr:CBS domain-containing protein [Candidatus Woesearchaeota archaeon]